MIVRTRKIVTDNSDARRHHLPQELTGKARHSEALLRLDRWPQGDGIPQVAVLSTGWVLNPDGAWGRLTLHRNPNDLRAETGRVYFRPDGEPYDVYQVSGNVMSPQRYVVTDLGEAVRSLRLRTGICEDGCCDVTKEVCDMLLASLEMSRE